MERNDARQEIRQRIPCSRYLKKSKSGLYVCPYCGSGEGKKQTGALKVYDTNTWTCHACNRSGDVIDLYQQDTGADYSTAISLLADELGITIDPYKPASYTSGHAAGDPKSNRTATGGETTAAAAETAHSATQEATGADYTEYYNLCAARLADPAALSYLQARGISFENAAAFWIGYDPAADPASAPGAMGDEYRPHPVPRLIIPTSPSHYVGRRIDDGESYKKINPKNGRPGIFNRRAIAGDSGAVFVTEGAFDALSVMETGRAAIALNSTSNAEKLIKLLEEKKPIEKTFILCLDNDDAGRNAAETLRAGMDRLNIKHVTADICNGCKDPNDALIKDRAAFAAAIQRAEEQPAEDKQEKHEPLPGIMVYDEVIKEFQEADDESIDIKSFPEFSKTAKIKRHSTVVIAADTGGGKSSLAINFLNDLNEKYPCIYFNLEMDRLTVLRRLVAIQSGIEINQVEGYRNDEQTAAAVNVYIKALTSRQPLQIVQDVYLLGQIEEIIKRSTAGRDDPTMVFIDHSLLVELSERTAGRYDRFTIISERLRKIALRYNVVLFVLLQQSRSGKADEEERPKNSSLKESGSWENDATQICFLWYDPADKRKKLLLTKNRHGDTGEFALTYWKQTQTYIEAKNQPAGPAAATGRGDQQKRSKRDKAREKLQAAYNSAVVATNGHPTLRAMAEAADVTTATVKGWIKEHGGCTLDGIPIDPAGIDTEVEYTGFIKLTPGDGDPFGELPEGKVQPVITRF